MRAHATSLLTDGWMRYPPMLERPQLPHARANVDNLSLWKNCALGHSMTAAQNRDSLKWWPSFHIALQQPCAEWVRRVAEPAMLSRLSRFLFFSWWGFGKQDICPRVRPFWSGSCFPVSLPQRLRLLFFHVFEKRSEAIVAAPDGVPSKKACLWKLWRSASGRTRFRACFPAPCPIE